MRFILAIIVLSLFSSDVHASQSADIKRTLDSFSKILDHPQYDGVFIHGNSTCGLVKQARGKWHLFIINDESTIILDNPHEYPWDSNWELAVFMTYQQLCID